MLSTCLFNQTVRTVIITEVIITTVIIITKVIIALIKCLMFKIVCHYLQKEALQGKLAVL